MKPIYTAILLLGISLPCTANLVADGSFEVTDPVIAADTVIAFWGEAATWPNWTQTGAPRYANGDPENNGPPYVAGNSNNIVNSLPSEGNSYLLFDGTTATLSQTITVSGAMILRLSYDLIRLSDGGGGTTTARLEVFDGADATAALLYDSGTKNVGSQARSVWTSFQSSNFSNTGSQVFLRITLVDSASSSLGGIDNVVLISTDSDGDGLIDTWEDTHFGDGDGIATPAELALQDGNGDGYPTADADGANNLTEQTAGSDPNNADSDGDGLGDGAEINGTANTYNSQPTSPIKSDTDGDGVSDFDEINGILNTAFSNAATDPTYNDSDFDSLLDGWEITYQLDPNSSVTPYGDIDDPDGDNLLNHEEQTYHTNPNIADTDGDGINDETEIFTTHTSPTLADTDKDGLSDSAEDLNHDGNVDTGETSATNADTDNDLFKDGYEVANASDPLDPASVPITTVGSFSNGNFELGTTNGFPPADANWGVPATADLLPVWTFGPKINIALRASNGTLGLGNGTVNIVSSTSDAQIAFVADTTSIPPPTDVTMRQTFTTVPGTVYLVKFEVGLISFAARNLAVTSTVFDGSNITASGTQLGQLVSAHSVVNGTHEYKSANYTFTATSTSSTITFVETSANTQSANIAIDNVVIEPVPAELKIINSGFNGSAFEVFVDGLNPSLQYVLKRSENLQDGFPTTVDGPRLPAGTSDTFVDPTPADPAKGFYRIEESP